MGTLGMQTPWALQGPFWWAPSLWNLLRWGAEWGPSEEPGTGVARTGSWALESRPCVGRMTSNGVTDPAGSAWWDHPPLSRAQSPGCLPALCIAQLWQGGLGGLVSPWVPGLVGPLGPGQPLVRGGAQGPQWTAALGKDPPPRLLGTCGERWAGPPQPGLAVPALASPPAESAVFLPSPVSICKMRGPRSPHPTGHNWYTTSVYF